MSAVNGGHLPSVSQKLTTAPGCGVSMVFLPSQGRASPLGLQVPRWGEGLVSEACPCRFRLPLESCTHCSYGKGCSANKDSHVCYGNAEYCHSPADPLLLSVIVFNVLGELMHQLPDREGADMVRILEFGFPHERRQFEYCQFPLSPREHRQDHRSQSRRDAKEETDEREIPVGDTA